ncbi:epoxyqueuosine reductase [Methanospirillum sp.]|uniref:epoxyqueuosine reductase n=1 Tax=Methanospirillum sp. TaxID=45200 RepID=UPI00359F1FA3
MKVIEQDNNLTDRILTMAKDLGADIVGVADPQVFTNPDYQGNNPLNLLPSLKSIILIGVFIPKGAFVPLPGGRGLYTNTLMAGTATLRVMAYSVARVLEREQYIATIAPSEGSEFGYWYADKKTFMADFSMKYAAYSAGLGSFGKNHLFISDAYGSRVRFTAILTDASLQPGTRSDTFIHKACMNCSACIDACPPKALKHDGTISRESCAMYMFETLGGLRCGMCIRACPLSCPEGDGI